MNLPRIRRRKASAPSPLSICLLAYLGDKQFFPNLKTITIAGSGAGGDFVLRYAAAGQAPDLLDPQGLKVAIRRRQCFVLSLFHADAAAWRASPASACRAPRKCPTYDSYKYGLDDLNDYARRTGANEIRLRYVARHVTYLIGEQNRSGRPFSRQ